MVLGFFNKKGWNGYVHAVQKYSLLLSSWCRYCGRQISCHKAVKLDDKGCEDKIIQFRHKVQGIQEILETDSKESKQYIQCFTEEETKETEESFRDIFKGLCTDPKKLDKLI